MSGPMARMYGAATLVGKDEKNGRINPAMDPDDDLPAAEAQKIREESEAALARAKKKMKDESNKKTTGEGHTAF